MRCTEWFGGRGADEPGPRAPAPQAWRLWALMVAVAIIAPLACSGTAS